MKEEDAHRVVPSAGARGKTSRRKGIDMSGIEKILVAAALFSVMAVTGVAFAEDVVVPVTPVTPVVVTEPIPVQEPNNWERFKHGAKEAGSAVAEGTKNTARKVGDGAERAGDAVVRGTKKAGHAIADGYEDAKDYVEEKLD